MLALRNGIKEVFWHLPAGLRTTLFPRVFPNIDRRLKLMVDGFSGENSLVPFKETKSVFIHLPKVAGVSISISLYGNRTSGHLPMRIVEHALGADEVSGFFRAAFVRNPYDRLHSAYRFLIKGGMNDADAALGKTLAEGYADFNDFVLRWLTPARAHAHTHFRPQVWFLKNLDGVIDLDFVGRFENIEEDFEKLREQLGFGEPLKKLNVTGGDRTSYRDAFNDDSKARAAQVYAADLEEFAYQF